MKRFALSLGLCLIAASATAQEYKEGLSGPAADTIGRYIEQTKIDCYKPAGETKCRIAETAFQTSVFYGSFLNGSAQHAIAFVTYQYDGLRCINLGGLGKGSYVGSCPVVSVQAPPLSSRDHPAVCAGIANTASATVILPR